MVSTWCVSFHILGDFSNSAQNDRFNSVQKTSACGEVLESKSSVLLNTAKLPIKRELKGAGQLKARHYYSIPHDHNSATMKVSGISVALLPLHCGMVAALHSRGLGRSIRQPFSITKVPSFRAQCPALFASNGGPSADALLRMVEEISNDQFSPEVMAKMSELEAVLSDYLEQEQQKKLSPRPPGIPPPMSYLEPQEDTLRKAEDALEKLRVRLRMEEESLRQAEQALQKSMEEEEVLRKAEEALQRSREAADKRKAEAIRRTEAAVASAEQIRLQQQQQVDSMPVNNNGRATISLDSLYGDDNGADDERLAYEISTQVPSGLPVLYNWVQYVDGSIRGQVKFSENFRDGSMVSTSPVQQGVQAGSVIGTSTGSQ